MLCNPVPSAMRPGQTSAFAVGRKEGKDAKAIRHLLRKNRRHTRSRNRRTHIHTSGTSLWPTARPAGTGCTCTACTPSGGSVQRVAFQGSAHIIIRCTGLSAVEPGTAEGSLGDPRAIVAVGPPI